MINYKKNSYSGKSSGFYKKNDLASKPWFSRVWHYLTKIFGWTFDKAKTIGWFVSVGFLILIMPTLIKQGLELESSLTDDMQQSM